MAAWNPLDEPTDYILLAYQRSPGIARVAGAGTPRNWDERKGYGFSGATLWFTGNGLAHFTVTLRLFTTEDWEAWDRWKSLVAKPPGFTRPKALDIWHPFLVDLGITSVVVEDLKQPEECEPGVWDIPILFAQYRAPKIALAKPEGSTDTPTDPIDVWIKQLIDQVNDLAR